MFNDWFSIGPVTIHGYGVMIAVGILAAVFFAEKQCKDHGLDADKIDGLALTAVIIGYIFSKLTYILTVFDQFLADPLSVLGSSGWVVYGGIIGGLFGAWLYCKIRKMDFMTYLNVCIPVLALAQGFGRIGCFLAGCCYGMPTHGALGVTFPEGSLCPIHEPVIPTQLISSFGDFVLFIILYKMTKSDTYRSKTGSMYLIVYSAGRFMIEFLRGDVIRGSVGPLSTSQFIAIFVFIAGIILYFMPNKKKESLTL